MEPQRIGIIGCGNISDIYMANAQSMFHNLELIACADSVKGKAQALAKKHGIAAFEVQELLERDDIDIVLNLTIPAAHAAVSMAALDSGKHVYSEKPLAVTLEEGLALLGKAKSKGLLLGCAPDTFLGGGLQTCRELIDDGEIGKPFGAIGFMAGYGPERFHPNPDFFYKKGAGPMFDMGPYYLTALVSLLGPVSRVTGIATAPLAEKTISGEYRHGETIRVETPTYINGLMEFKNGVCANLLTTFDLQDHYTESGLPFLRIFGTDGTLTLPDPNTFDGPVFIKRNNSEKVPIPLSHGYTSNCRGIGLADFAVAVSGEGIVRANGALALHVLEIMAGIQDSSTLGTHVALSHPCERPAPLGMNVTPSPGCPI